MGVSRALVGVVASVSLAVWACGDEAPPPVAQPTTPPAQPEVGAGGAAELEAAAATAQETQLVREVFSYRGSGRDPFMSLLRSGDVRPLIEDLRVTTINFNPRYPSASIAVLRDTTVNQRYTVRVGDELGRLRIAEIREREIVVVLEEFGVERQPILRLGRRREG